MKKNLIILGLVSVIALGSGLAIALASDLTVVINSPTANASFPVGSQVEFEATAMGGNPVHYAYMWNFGDGTFAAGQTYVKSYDSAGSKTISVTVTDFDGTQVSVSRVINITEAPAPAPTVDLKVNGQDSPVTIATSTAFTLSWTSANVTACTASGAWSGARSTSGSETLTSPSTANTSMTFTLACTGPGGNTSDSVTVTTVDDPTPGSLVITNVRVTDVTATSAIVRWTTNRPATSRVIYDTVSRSIAGQNPPNFGYSFSTGTSTAKVTEHAVTVSGLSPSTTYFFRAVSQE